MYVCTYTYIYIYIYIYICICIYTYIHIYIYMCICIHIYMHINASMQIYANVVGYIVIYPHPQKDAGKRQLSVFQHGTRLTFVSFWGYCVSLHHIISYICICIYIYIYTYNYHIIYSHPGVDRLGKFQENITKIGI